jgi:hypothetical protein
MHNSGSAYALISLPLEGLLMSVPFLFRCPFKMDSSLKLKVHALVCHLVQGIEKNHTKELKLQLSIQSWTLVGKTQTNSSAEGANQIDRVSKDAPFNSPIARQHTIAVQSTMFALRFVE